MTGVLPRYRSPRYRIVDADVVLRHDRRVAVDQNFAGGVTATTDPGCGPAAPGITPGVRVASANGFSSRWQIVNLFGSACRGRARRLVLSCALSALTPTVVR